MISKTKTRKNKKDLKSVCGNKRTAGMYATIYKDIHEKEVEIRKYQDYISLERLFDDKGKIFFAYKFYKTK